MVMIKGIRVESINISRDDKTGMLKISGYYELISNADVVLAKQAFNGYESIKLEPAGDSARLLQEFAMSIKNDLENILGLKEVSK